MVPLKQAVLQFTKSKKLETKFELAKPLKVPYRFPNKSDNYQINQRSCISNKKQQKDMEYVKYRTDKDLKKLSLLNGLKNFNVYMDNISDMVKN